MDSRRRCIQLSITKNRTILVNTYQEQKSLEQTLERTSQLYRQLHVERRHLVETWKEAINQMNQREKNINETERVRKAIIYDNRKKTSFFFFSPGIRAGKSTLQPEVLAPKKAYSFVGNPRDEQS
jgi:hypothetical protein